MHWIVLEWDGMGSNGRSSGDLIYFLPASVTFLIRWLYKIFSPKNKRMRDGCMDAWIGEQQEMKFLSDGEKIG
jgi:hypothetical protein